MISGRTSCLARLTRECDRGRRGLLRLLRLLLLLVRLHSWNMRRQVYAPSVQLTTQICTHKSLCRTQLNLGQVDAQRILPSRLAYAPGASTSKLDGSHQVLSEAGEILRRRPPKLDGSHHALSEAGEALRRRPPQIPPSQKRSGETPARSAYSPRARPGPSAIQQTRMS